MSVGNVSIIIPCVALVIDGASLVLYVGINNILIRNKSLSCCHKTHITETD